MFASIYLCLISKQGRNVSVSQTRFKKSSKYCLHKHISPEPGQIKYTEIMEDLDPFSIWSRCQLSKGGGQLHNSPLYHKTNTESPELWRETWRHGGNTERPEAWESNP